MQLDFTGNDRPPAMTLGDEEAEKASAFIRAHLATYEQLSVLRLLAREGGRSWTAAAVARELGISDAAAAQALDHLCSRNLLDIRIGGELHFRYSPGSQELARRAEAFLRALEKDPVTLVRLMAAHQREHQRQSALQAFVDAFLLRGPRNDG